MKLKKVSPRVCVKLSYSWEKANINFEFKTNSSFLQIIWIFENDRTTQEAVD